jgi:predicted metalloprotease with PDZ domain
MNIKPILYSVEPFDLAGHRFRVTMTIPDPTAAGQTICLPAWIPGSYLIRDFARHIETIQARAGARQISVTKTDNHSWRCGASDSAITITYTVYAWDLSVRGAHLDESHGFFNGTSVFLYAQGQEHKPCEVTLIAPKKPARWSVFTSLPEATKGRLAAKPHGFGKYRADNYDALIDHPIEMGIPQTIKFTACGARHELVFTGHIPNLDLKRISQDVKRICESQIRFFEPEQAKAPFLDSATRYVFMTMVTGDGYGGLEHRASTALMASRIDLPIIGQERAPEGYKNYLGLVSHEYFHTWNVKRIKPAAFAPYDLSRENHTRLLWIFEGFTSYYDDLILLRSGVIDRHAYFELLAKQISGVWSTPGRLKQSVADSSFDAWTRYYKQDENSPNALISYYTKGSLIALGLDLTIRQQTYDQFSLDDVMRGLWENYGRDFYTGQAQGLKEQGFIKLVRQITGVDVSTEIAQWAYGTADVPLTQLLHAQNIELSWKASDARASIDARIRKQGDHAVISTVLENGAAHQAGLSAMDTLVAIDGLRIDSNANALDSILNRYAPGDVVTVHVFRRDELRSFDVRLTAPAITNCVLKDLNK